MNQYIDTYAHTSHTQTHIIGVRSRQTNRIGECKIPFYGISMNVRSSSERKQSALHLSRLYYFILWTETNISRRSVQKKNCDMIRNCNFLLCRVPIVRFALLSVTQINVI